MSGTTGTTIADVYSAIDHLPGDTAIERALIEYRYALFELASSGRLRDSRISQAFDNQPEPRDMQVKTRLDVAFKRKPRIP